MKMLWKLLIIGLSSVSVSGIVSYSVTPRKSVEISRVSSSKSEEEKVRDERVKNLKKEFMESPYFEGELDFDLTYKDYNFKLQSDVLVELNSNLNLNIESKVTYKEKTLDLGINYYEGTLYLDTYEGKFKFSDADISEFFSLITSYGISFELPSEMGNFSLGAITDLFDSFEVKDEEEKYVFYIDSEELDFCIETTTSYKITEIRLNNLSFDDFSLSLNYKFEENELVKGHPLDQTNYLEAFEMRPLFESLSSIVEERFFDLDFDLLLANEEVNIGFKGQGNVDLANQKYNVDLEINYKDEITKLGLAYLDKSAYASLNSYLKAKLSQEELNILVEKVTSKLKLDDPGFENFIEKIKNLQIVNELKDGKYEEIIDLIKNIQTSNTSLSVELNLNELEITADKVEVVIDLTSTSLVSLNIEGLDVEGFSLSGNISLNNFSEIDKDFSLYDDFSFVNDIFDQVETLFNSDKFALDFNFEVFKDDNAYLNLNCEGKIDTSKKEACASLTINQGNMNHNIKLDLNENQEIYMSYNDSLNAKSTINDVSDLVKNLEELLNKFNKDGNNDNSLDIIEKLLENFDTSLLLDLIKSGNYPKLLSDEYIKRLEFKDNILYLTISKSLFSLPSDINIEARIVNGNLEDIKIVDFVVENYSLNALINVKPLNKDIEHLLPLEGVTYIDLKAASKLVESMSKTLDSKTFHLNGQVGVSFSIPNMSFLPDVNMKIGYDAYLDFESSRMLYLLDIPGINGVNVKDTSSVEHKITCNIYVNSDYVYIERIDKYKLVTYTNKFPFVKTEDKEDIVNKKYTNKYFLEHILDILLKDVIGLNDNVFDALTKPKSEENTVAEVEEGTSLDFSKILKDFSYLENEDGSGVFVIALDLNGLIKNISLGEINTQIEHNSEKLITKISLTTSISSQLPIGLSLEVNITDHNSPWSEETCNVFNSYIANHIDSEVDDIYEEVTI